MPRVVPDQRSKCENEEFFRKLSRECEIKYTGFRDRPHEERQTRFQNACRDGRSEIVLIQDPASAHILVLGYRVNVWTVALRSATPRVSSEKPLKEFQYRYNTPGQNYLNHNGRGALAQSCFLHENKKSSPSCSKQKWICSQRVNSESFQDASDSTTGKKHRRTVLTHSPDPETPSSHFSRVSGIKSSHDGKSTEETESKILNALDHALRAATVLKKMTDQND